MPPGDVAPVLITGLIILAVAAVLILRGPLGRALARRIEGTAGHDEPAVQALTDRVADLELREARIGELEERLDFAERMLAQRDPERVQRGRDT
jgi:hypothetical protein